MSQVKFEFKKVVKWTSRHLINYDYFKLGKKNK